MEHQNDDHGVPKSDDDTVGLFSFRSWGDLMAAIWSEEEDKDYDYLNFYMWFYLVCPYLKYPKKPEEKLAEMLNFPKIIELELPWVFGQLILMQEYFSLSYPFFWQPA